MALEDIRQQGNRVSELERELASERLERAREKAARDYGIDAELVNDLPFTSPEEITAYARKLAARMPTTSGSGVPLPPSNSGEAMLGADEQQKRRWQVQLRNNHLRRQMDPVEAEMAFETFFGSSWNEHMAERKRRSGK